MVKSLEAVFVKEGETVGQKDKKRLESRRRKKILFNVKAILFRVTSCLLYILTFMYTNYIFILQKLNIYNFPTLQTLESLFEMWQQSSKIIR